MAIHPGYNHEIQENVQGRKARRSARRGAKRHFARLRVPGIATGIFGRRVGEKGRGTGLPPAGSLRQFPRKAPAKEVPITAAPSRCPLLRRSSLRIARCPGGRGVPAPRSECRAGDLNMLALRRTPLQHREQAPLHPVRHARLRARAMPPMQSQSGQRGKTLPGGAEGDPALDCRIRGQNTQRSAPKVPSRRRRSRAAPSGSGVPLIIMAPCSAITSSQGGASGPRNRVRGDAGAGGSSPARSAPAAPCQGGADSSAWPSRP